MRLPAILIPILIPILPILFTTAAGSHPRASGFYGTQPVAQTVPQNSEGNIPAPTGNQTVIEPGLSVGPLKLGDTQARALELFPLKKDQDQEWQNRCGTTLYWVDADNQIRGGSMFIRLKKGKVFQIESATTRFRTAEGITSLDRPDKVEEKYKDLRAYTLLNSPNPALGDRPLIFWIDKKKGIAFVLAYYPSQRRRYVYKIIVFWPNKTFCPEEETMDSPKWQEIPPYSLELPADLALNLHPN